MPFVNLISSDGQPFKVPLGHALISPTIRTMLDTLDHNTVISGNVCIRFREISSRVLSAVIDYFDYKVQFNQAPDSQHVPPFRIDPTIGIQLLVAADFFQC